MASVNYQSRNAPTDSAAEAEKEDVAIPLTETRALAREPDGARPMTS